jgi:hypothetical protein
MTASVGLVSLNALHRRVVCSGVTARGWSRGLRGSPDPAEMSQQSFRKLHQAQRSRLYQFEAGLLVRTGYGNMQMRQFGRRAPEG